MQDIFKNIQKRPHLTKVIDDFLKSKGVYRERSGMPGMLAYEAVILVSIKWD